MEKTSTMLKTSSCERQRENKPFDIVSLVSVREANFGIFSMAKLGALYPFDFLLSIVPSPSSFSHHNNKDL